MKKNNNSNFIPKILLYGVITSALFIIIGLIKIAYFETWEQPLIILSSLLEKEGKTF